ncbi:MAG: hypothetical protein D6767_02260 [Candidatus Hydrogenedentota bacterium]|nr:MAG: hypothetical protein D6767_02260 [Candidatus Hydrogenedentota bacterium]
MQGILLDTLKNKKYIRPGGRKEISLSQNFIFSSEVPLEAMVMNNTFRQDLFFVLAGYPLELPSLKNRKEDISEIVSNWLRVYNATNGSKIILDGTLLRQLENRSWDGETNELYSTLQKIVDMIARNKEGSVMATSDAIAKFPIAKFQREENKIPQIHLFSEIAHSGQYEPSLEEVEKQYILQVLKNHPYNLSEVARILGISRKTLYAKLTKYGINGNTKTKSG